MPFFGKHHSQPENPMHHTSPTLIQRFLASNLDIIILRLCITLIFLVYGIFKF